MPINHKDTPISDADMTAIKTAFSDIKGLLKNQAVNLTEQERVEISTLGDVRYPYAQRTIKSHAINVPKVVPPFKPLADAQDSLKLYEQLAELIPLAKEVLELTIESQQLPGHNCYGFLRGVYNQAIEADEAGVTGSGVVRQDIAQLFEGQGNFNNNAPTPPVL